MLPGSRGVDRWTMSMVTSPARKGTIMPPPTLQVTLDPDAQAELERRYHTTRDAQTRTRYQIVLLNAQGHTSPQIGLELTRFPGHLESWQQGCPREVRDGTHLPAEFRRDAVALVRS